jgi:hypothetical protein
MTTRFRASPDALATRVGDELVVVHTGSDQIFALNRTGARVWELLCGDADRGEIEARLAAEFDVSPAELTAGVGDVIASLLDTRLIERLADA